MINNNKYYNKYNNKLKYYDIYEQTKKLIKNNINYKFFEELFVNPNNSRHYLIPISV
jgi:hypothetical protein